MRLGKHAIDHVCTWRQVLNRRGENEWSQHVADTAAETGLSGANGLFEVAARSYRMRRSQSSMDEGDSGSDDDFSTASSSLSSNGRGRNGTQVIRTRSILSRINGSSDSGSDEDSGSGTQVIKARRKRNGASRAVSRSESGASLRSVDEGGEDGEGSAAGKDRGRGRVPARQLKGPAPTAEGRLRDEVDSW